MPLLVVNNVVRDKNDKKAFNCVSVEIVTLPINFTSNDIQQQFGVLSQRNYVIKFILCTMQLEVEHDICSLTIAAKNSAQLQVS